MKTTHTHRPVAGFTMVELLISLALMGAILAATAVAMQGVFMSYTENEKIASVTQTARVVLHRMMREIRTADAVTSTASSINIIPAANAENVEEIEYDLENGALYYRQTIGGITNSTLILDSTGDVELVGLTVARETGMEGQVSYTKRVTVQFVVRAGGNVLDVTASVCPRRNLQL